MNYIITEKEDIQTNIKTIAFVDYETWAYGCSNQYSTEPDIMGWFEDLKGKGQIDEVFFFADFSQESIKNHSLKLRNISNNLIDCSKGEKEKDYSDFIMLDHIYQKSVRRSDVKQFVLFTGDGHFQSVVAFLRNFADKKIGIYALKGSLSPQLSEAANWYVEVVPTNARHDMISQCIINNLKWIDEKQSGLIPTFRKTIEAVHRSNSEFSEDEIRSVLSELIEKNFIQQTETTVPSTGRKIRGLFLIEEK